MQGYAKKSKGASAGVDVKAPTLKAGNQEAVRFGKNVRDLREFAGLTQERLAEKVGLGCNQDWVSTVELGKADVSLVEASKFAKGLGVKLSTLFIGL